MNPFIERHQDNITRVLTCFDRVVVTGSLPHFGHADALARFLGFHGIKLFDFPRWAEPLRDELRHHADAIAVEAGLEIEFIRQHKTFRKKDRIKAILAERGDHPDLVHIFSVMEACSSFCPWHDKQAGHRKWRKSFSANTQICCSTLHADTRLLPELFSHLQHIVFSSFIFCQLFFITSCFFDNFIIFTKFSL
jgi:hypothetical protein